MNIEIISRKLSVDKWILRSVVQAIRWRSEKYSRIWISRTEYQYFWLGEMKLRQIIDYLRQIGFINKVGMEKSGKYMCNVYVMHDFFDHGIDRMNEKIVSWCRSTDVKVILSYFGVTCKGLRIWWVKSITFNRRSHCIADWKTWKKWNLFNYIRDTFDIPPYKLAKMVWMK